MKVLHHSSIHEAKLFFRTNYDRWQKMAGAAENRVEVVSIFFRDFVTKTPKPRPVKYFVFGDCEWSEEEKTLAAL